jgi:glycosyltransferase involved in cell wall biosynthesis
MALFLYRLLESTDRYEPVLVSLSIAADDALSVRLLDPSSWWHGVQTRSGIWRGLQVTHVGVFLAEFEFQRFRPRPALAEFLEHFDLVQVVAGTPAMGMAVAKIQKPRCLFAATTIRRERVSLLAATSGARRLWLKLMTAVNDRNEQRALGLMDHVFALSEYTYADLAAMVPAFKLSLGVPGVDTELFHPAHSPPTDGCILSVGRLSDPRKNVRLLLDAYQRLRDRLPDAPRLVLVGGDLPSQDWVWVSEWGLADRIEVCLDLTSEELAPLYRQASLFVLSSNEEGLGIVILEAMASGLPVVGTRCGGPETCVVEGETGYLVPVGDAEALARSMQVLLEDRALGQQMGKAGRMLVESRFSIEAAGRPFLEVYDRLLSERAWRRGA